jgi:hypothetical protein
MSNKNKFWINGKVAGYLKRAAFDSGNVTENPGQGNLVVDGKTPTISVDSGSPSKSPAFVNLVITSVAPSIQTGESAGSIQISFAEYNVGNSVTPLVVNFVIDGKQPTSTVS